MEKYINRYLGYLKLRGCAENTIISYKSQVKVFVEELGDRKIIKLSDITAIMEKKKWNYPAIYQFIKGSTGFVDFLIQEGRLKENPLIHFHLKAKERKAYLIFSEEDIRQIQMVSEKNMGFEKNLVIRLLVETGARCNEIFNILVKNIDLEKRSIYLVITKGSRPRYVFFGTKTAELLAEYISQIQTERLFGKWKSFGIIGKIVEKTVGVAFPFDIEKRKATPHTFRHTFVTRWVKKNGNLGVLKDIMGWRNLNMLDTYANLRVDTLNDEYKKMQGGE